MKKCWVISPQHNAEFVACMEDVLDLYQQPYDPDYPVICMDEKPYQLLGETRPTIPMKKGQPKRIDDEYIRNGTCCIFLFAEALAGWRHADPQEHRTKVDWANQIRHLLETDYLDCQKVRLVMDNLNTYHLIAVRGLRIRHCPESCQKNRNSPHAEAWQLAKHCRNRIERYDQTMSGSKSQQYGLSADRDEVLGNSKKHNAKGC